jgi:hypothetical protein
MEKLDILFTLSPNYKNQFVDIQETNINLSFELENGKHVIKTTPIDIGRLMYFNDSILQAQLSFSYEFDAENKIITVCGTDYSIKDSMCLITFPKGTTEYCYQGYSNCAINDEGSLYNPNWNYNTQMTPNLEDLFVDIIKEANNTLIETIKEQLEGITIRIKTLPPKLFAEEYLNTLIVYKENEFVGIHDPNLDYGEGYSFKSIESVWGGTVRFTQGENFSNVIGSTNDPHIGGLSWIKLWENQFGPATICTSYQYNGFNCNNHLVGGHIILGKQAQKVPAGSNSVYIMPICNANNNNDNVYMAALKYLDGIWLKNYLN